MATGNERYDLLPCPCCDGEAGLKEYKPNVSGVAICKECGMRSRICKNDHTGGWKPKAIEAWNTRAERTCELDGTISWEWQTVSTTFYTHSLSCGHDVTTTEPEPPKHCEECGAKVMWG